ncbi:MAG: SufE family protein [Acidobacteriota bacterium]
MKINDIQNEIIKEMSELDDWMDKYEYLINLGRSFNPPVKKIRNDDNALMGCQSKVWISAELKDQRVFFFADSDSLIIRGLLALLMRVLNNQHPKDIVSSNLYFIEQTGLSTNLSPSRANGLASIVKHLKLCAAKFATTDRGSVSHHRNKNKLC